MKACMLSLAFNWLKNILLVINKTARKVIMFNESDKDQVANWQKLLILNVYLLDISFSFSYR